MNGHTWQDTLLWSIRPDCHTSAQSLIARISDTLTPESAGLHRDNLWKSFTSSVAKSMQLDELPIDMHGEHVAIISVIGELIDFVNPFTANYPLLTAAFDRCRLDENIKAVVVRFCTPGGTVSGLHDCAMALDKLAATKLTIAQNDGGCYSAGYYLACCCGSICSGPTDQLGNIGTVSTLHDFSKYCEYLGVRTIVKRTGPIKGLGVMGDAVTGIQEDFLQHLVDAHYAYFRYAVISGREMSDDEFAAVSDGKWWLGSEALDNKIIDQISTLAETLAQLDDSLAAVQHTTF